MILSASRPRTCPRTRLSVRPPPLGADTDTGQTHRPDNPEEDPDDDDRGSSAAATPVTRPRTRRGQRGRVATTDAEETMTATTPGAADRRRIDPWWRSRCEQRHLPADVADLLTDARRRHGWSVRAAAQQVGCSPTHLGRLERGERVPSVALAWDLAAVLQLGTRDAERLVSVAAPYAGRSSPLRTGVDPGQMPMGHNLT